MSYHDPPAEFDVRDEEMVCTSCATKSTADPHRPGIKHQSDQWDELKESGKCVRCWRHLNEHTSRSAYEYRKEIDQLRERLAEMHKLYDRAIRERDIARAEAADLEAS